MGKITTKISLLILFLSLSGATYTQTQEENTYPYPHYDDVGVGTPITTDFINFNTNYKLTAASRLFTYKYFDENIEEDIVVPKTIPFRILAERYEDFHDDNERTEFLFEARVFPFEESAESNKRVFSLQDRGQILLGENSNSTTSYGFSYSLVSDQSIYSQSSIFAQDRIGIGTTNPVMSLDVRGAVTVNSNKIFLKDGNTNSKNYLKYHSSYYGNSIDGTVVSGTSGGALGASNGGVLYWKSNGRIGIGTFNPASTLEVNGSVKFDSDALTNDEVQFETHNGFHRIAYSSLRFHESGFGDILTLSDGKVGIGTTSPASKLDIDGGNVSLNDNGLRLRGATDGNHYLQFKLSFLSESVDGPILSGHGGGVLASSYGGEKNVLRWTHQGRVGINKNNPSRSLDVNGDIHANGGIESSGSTGGGNHAFLSNYSNFSGSPININWYNSKTPKFVNLLGTNNPHAGFGIADGDGIHSPILWMWNSGNDDNALRVKTMDYNQDINSGVDLMVVKEDGKVGINTSSPSAALEVIGMVKFDGDNADDELISKSFPGYRSLEFNQLRFHEYGEGNVLTLSGGKIGIWNTTPSVELDVRGTIQAEALPGSNALVVKNANSTAFDFMVKGNGYVYAREVKITMDPFPDYVFDEKYDLMSLEELRKYISKNNHLPGVKSADEVEKEGIGLGELSKVQMEKIEELTLYILQMEERIKQLEAKLNE